MNAHPPEHRPPSRPKTANFAFPALLAVLATFPAWRIDRSSVISETEKRHLAAFPSLCKDGRPNLRFGEDFENWYQDRFWGRAYAIRLHSAMLGAIDGRVENDLAFGKRHGWMFLSEATRDSFGWSGLPAAQKEGILSGLERQNDYLAKRGIRFCFLLAPVKATIYPEHAEWRYRRKGPSRAEALLDEIRSRIPGPVVFPKQAILARKRDGLLYHPADSHWNMFGSRVAFFELIRALDFGQVLPDDDHPSAERILDPTIPEDPFDVARLLGVSAVAHPYSLPADGPWYGSQSPERVAVENPDAPIPLSLMIVGDSFRCRLGPWAAAFFRRSFVVHRRRYVPGMVEEFGPDVVVGEYAERMLDEAAGFTFETGLP